jgi:hypothetical protein
MKNIQMLQEKKEEMNKLCDEINKLNCADKKEKLIIATHWIDFINTLLYWNLYNFCLENKLDPDEYSESLENLNNIPKEIIINEEQAIKELEWREKLYNDYPYGTCKNSYYINGIYIEKLELDILKWLLERE